MERLEKVYTKNLSHIVKEKNKGSKYNEYFTITYCNKLHGTNNRLIRINKNERKIWTIFD